MFTYLFERNFSVAISRLMLFTLVAVLPFMGGCGEDENPILDDHDDDHEVDAPLHADADGFNLEVNGTVVYHQHKGTHEGGLTVAVGEEIEVHVVFIDANEAEVHLDEVVPPPDEHGDDEHGHDGAEAFSLGLSGYDSSIIDIHLHEDEEEHDDDDEEHDDEEHDDEEHDDEEHGEEELHFAVAGLKAGKTEIKLQLLHGDHPDFTAALPIPVTVQ